MIKITKLLSIILVTVMALTVVSGAGVMKAQAAVPTSDEIATMLDCSSLGWTFTPTVATWGPDLTGGSASMTLAAQGVNDNRLELWADSFDSPTSGATAQIQTTAPGPGQVTVRWLKDYLINGKFEFLVDGEVKWTAPANEPREWADIGPITVAEGQALTWRVTTTSTEAIVTVSLDYLRWDAASPADTTPPVVSTGGPYTGDAGVPIAFSGTASDAGSGVKSVTWDFGDGSTPSAGPTASHAYDKAGTYTATLSAVDNAGNPPATAQTTVTVNPTQASVKTEIAALQSAPIAFTNANNHKAFDSKLSEVSNYITAEDYTTALAKVQKDMIPKADGNPKPADWVTATSQPDVYAQLQSIVSDLQQLQQ